MRRPRRGVVPAPTVTAPTTTTTSTRPPNPFSQLAPFVGSWANYNTVVLRVSPDGLGEYIVDYGAVIPPATAKFRLTGVNSTRTIATGIVTSSQFKDFPVGGPLTFTVADHGNALKLTTARGGSFLGCNSAGSGNPGANPGCDAH